MGVPSLCQPVIPRLCYCLSYGHDDPCFIYYYMQRLDDAIVPVPGDATSTGRFRGGQTEYWHKFEFVTSVFITNYAIFNKHKHSNEKGKLHLHT